MRRSHDRRKCGPALRGGNRSRSKPPKWGQVPLHRRGQASAFSFRVALATVGGGTYELITPHSGRSIYDEHLEQHGEGFDFGYFHFPEIGAFVEVLYLDAARLPAPETIIQPSS